jgi:hypothetical protein
MASMASQANKCMMNVGAGWLFTGYKTTPVAVSLPAAVLFSLVSAGASRINTVPIVVCKYPTSHHYMVLAEPWAQ